jgi:hypothetical protein
MTDEERRIYDTLDRADKAEYDHIKQQHPAWSSNQIMSKLSISKNMDDTIEHGQDPNDSSIFKIILEKARDWLRLLGLPAAVIMACTNAIEYIGNLIIKGITRITDFILNKISSLF